MGLITKTVMVKWNGNNRKWYENKGRIYTKLNDEFEVKVEDLLDNSNVLVEVKCDNPSCENPYLKPMKWNNYLKYIQKDGKYYCKKCAMKLYGTEKYRISRLKNGISFEQWCMTNNKLDILSRWDYEKNIDKNGNAIKPSDISHSAKGKYWFKCLNHLEHKSELKKICDLGTGKQQTLDCIQCNSFAQYLIDIYGKNALNLYWSDKNKINPWIVSKNSHTTVYIICQNKDKPYHKDYKVQCSHFVEMNCRCPYCTGRQVHKYDSLGYLYPQTLSIWSEKNDKSPYEYSPHSNKEVWWRCPDGIHKDFKRKINVSNICNFQCPSCNNFSKGEIKIEEFLMSNNIDYEPQKDFNGLIGTGGGKLSYDFYLPSPYNLLIEYQGEYHDGKANYYVKQNLKKQQEHDRRKREYAKSHNINLLEIWYYSFDNIEEILSKELGINDSNISSNETTILQTAI